MQSLLNNFALILFILLLVSGGAWFYDRFVLLKKRKLVADEAIATIDAREKKLQAQNIKVDSVDRVAIRKRLMKRPSWVEYTGSFFPVIAVVFFFRSFLWEPFRIPSGSMLPTLWVGDMILVNKFSYGIRLPIINTKVISFSDPQRGDVVVFKFPKDTSLDYVKRVIGVGGDKIEYYDKQLRINGVLSQYQPQGEFLDKQSLTYSTELNEQIGDTQVQHHILNNKNFPAYVPHPEHFENRHMCSYDAKGFTCTVPEGYYFMMGDNRDNSYDSRYWGFVSDKYLVGRASVIWLNIGNMDRIGAIR